MRPKKYSNTSLAFTIGIIVVISAFVFSSTGVTTTTSSINTTYTTTSTSCTTQSFAFSNSVTCGTTTCSCSGGGGGGGGGGCCTTNTSSKTSRSTSTTSITTCTGSASQCSANPFWNANSQAVADLVVSQGYNSQVQMLHDIDEPGCTDYEGGDPCDSTYWTTSDNMPTAWTLASFGYSSTGQAIINKVTALGALQYNSGIFENRYEAYVGVPIITGNPTGGLHGVIQDTIPGPVILATSPGTPYSAMHNSSQSGTNSLGNYKIQFDGSTGGGFGTPTPSATIDVAGPQAINAWLRGNYKLGQSIAMNIVSRWDGYGFDNSSGTYTTWQTGQALFVMRVFGYDTNTSSITTAAGKMTYASVFGSAVNELWSIQYGPGYLPNSYTSSGPASSHDPESQDSGLLPFCYSCVMNIQNNFGQYNANSEPV